MKMNKNKKGTIEVICGPMFSGKTEELIRRLVRGQIAKKNVSIFKNAVDNNARFCFSFNLLRFMFSNKILLMLIGVSTKI